MTWRKGCELPSADTVCESVSSSFAARGYAVTKSLKERSKELLRW